MARKKVLPTIEATDINVLKDALEPYRRVAKLAYDILVQRALLSTGSRIYPDDYSFNGPSITTEGVYFYTVEQAQWSDGWDIETLLVTWDDLSTETLEQLHKDVARKQREDAEARDNWKREQYERLKAELGES